MSRHNTFLGLDIGASNCKAIVIDDAEQVLALTCNPMPEIIHSNPDCYEISPDELRGTVLKTLKETIAAAGCDITAIGISGQMHGMMFLGRDGEPAGNIISWQDQRTLRTKPGTDQSYLAVFSDLLSGVLEKTGSRLRPGMMGPLLYWFKEHPDLVPEFDSVTFMPDYMVGLLTDTHPASNPTQAAASGVYDLFKNRWLAAFKDDIGIPSDALPQLTKIGRYCDLVCEELMDELGLKGKTVVYSSVGDFQAALFGAGLTDKDFSINIGTGAQVSHISSQHRTFVDFETRPFFDGKALYCNPGLSAGRAIALFKGFVESVGRYYGTDDPVELIASIEQNITPEMMEDTPFCSTGFYSAGGGSISHIKPDNFTIEKLYAGIVKDLCQGYAEAFESMTAATHFRPSRILLSGGVARKSQLLRSLLQAQFSGIEVALSEQAEEAAMGAALLTKKWHSQVEEF